MDETNKMTLEVAHIATLKGHSGCVYAMDRGFSEHTIFTGGSDRYIALWNLETLKAEKFSAALP